MDDRLCRISVQRDDSPGLVDIALPATTHLGTLLPAIVDLLHDNTEGISARWGWHLKRLGGSRLDDSMTLAENGINDGDIVTLADADTPPHIPMRRPDHLYVAAAPDIAHAQLHLHNWVWLWASITVAATMIYAGIQDRDALGPVVSAVLATATAWATGRRVGPDHRFVLNTCVVLFAGVSGFLLVPGGPAAPNVVLAAAAATGTAALLIRCSEGDTLAFSALGVAGTLIGAVAAVSVALSVAPTVSGTILCALSLLALGIAPRWAVLIAGLLPALACDPDDAADLVETRVARGRAALASVVIGASAAAALGALTVAAGCYRGDAPWQSGLALTAVLGSLLALRARLHAAQSCRYALIASGSAILSASFALLAVSAPMAAGYTGPVAIGAVGLWCTRGHSCGPVLARGVDIAEYALLVALAPLGCWVTDIYATARSLGHG